MSVWVCVPSKRPAAEVKRWAEAWRDMGYQLAIKREEVDGLDKMLIGYAHVPTYPSYMGYAKETNLLITTVLEVYPDARWCVIGGDDVWPDTTKRADEIARECEEHFGGGDMIGTLDRNLLFHTFGVMQPTGDAWADGMGRIIERIAGSAWIGREFALLAYGGNGPLWPEYRHMFPDEELQCVAQKLGVFWQRPDLTQRHEHWARKAGATREDIPEFLTEANSAAHWAKYKGIFEARKAAGFPGHEVKP